MTVQCFECYVACNFADGLTACPRHASAEEREAANRRVLELAFQPHPLLSMLRKL